MSSIPSDVTSATVAGMDIGKLNPDHMTDVPRMKQGGMGAQFFAVYVAASYVEGNHAANRTLQQVLRIFVFVNHLAAHITY